MKRISLSLAFALAPAAFLIPAAACKDPKVATPKDSLGPPVAAKVPHNIESPQGTRVDNYYWLRDDTRKDKRVLAHLRAENLYAEAQLAPARELENTLYEEMLSRVKQDDSAPPTFDRGYYYYSRTEVGKERPIFARKKGSLSASEEILLDANKLAVGHSFYSTSPVSFGPSSRLMAYIEDTVGRNRWVLKIKDLASGAILDAPIELISGSATFSEDGKYLFYVRKDETTLRSSKVYRHQLGTPVDSDVLVYEETDDTFSVGLGKSQSRKFIFIVSYSTTMTEFRAIDALAPTTPAKVLFARKKDHEYSLDHIGDRFVIRTNWKATNFRIASVETAKISDQSAWKDIVPHRAETFVSNFDVTETYLATEERAGGMLAVKVLGWAGGESKQVGEPSSAGTTRLISSRDPSVTSVRILYTDLVTPQSIFDIDVNSGERTLVKRQPVLGGFDASLYATERLWVTARDGVKVPATIAYRKDRFKRDGTNPALVYGYGSYGITIDPRFSSRGVSLLDRGFVYVLAHIRGSQALGRPWYEDGKLLHKKNTFTDFVDVTQYMIDQKIASAGKITAMGGSAGGLLMGAVVNMRPDLYRAMIAHVPFVDVVTTMLDEDIPLTTGEFDEWGNPKQKVFYDYMLSYSPYDNVKPQAYPSMLITTGLHDSQVQYFEPAKWTAKLREIGVPGNPIIMTVNMEAGHGGKSGRFERLREVARDYAFLITQLATPDPRKTH